MWESFQLDIECIVCNKTLQKINHKLPRDYKMRKISRRSRTPNWSPEEKQYLLDLIKERKEIVINKPNAPNNYEEKDVAWNEILQELTSKFGPKFTEFSIKKLKTQWQNMKRIAREEISLNGPTVNNYTRQSFEVCNILDLVKNGEIKQEEKAQSIETILKTDIEIKTECIDDDLNVPSCKTQSKVDTIIIDSSSSFSEPMDLSEPTNEIDSGNHKTAETMTDAFVDINLFPGVANDFLRFSTTQKEMKMEALKEEMQIIRSMRETAELNKIIAEQKLKHVLWVKKQEMA
ncbi:unnamed protein product [Pieris macdunnoughi]|nr:unnamed protein product [Pieris macdunnoughi]